VTKGGAAALQRADLSDKGVNYRLRIGPSASEQAQKICGSDQAAGGNCLSSGSDAAGIQAMSYRAPARFYFHRWKSLTDANHREVARGRWDILVGSGPEDNFVLD